MPPAYFAGEIPWRLMLLIVFTNWLWIPFILWGDLAVRRGISSGVVSTTRA